jgi:hypothetical protein
MLTEPDPNSGQAIGTPLQQHLHAKLVDPPSGSSEWTPHETPLGHVCEESAEDHSDPLRLKYTPPIFGLYLIEVTPL